ncbi:hypothetical protein HY933_00700 [Candidatus Falkowbacteria bacterium]|nr:hypothetical protein [Candidatus Falkowbacteria bacterium]
MVAAQTTSISRRAIPLTIEWFREWQAEQRHRPIKGRLIGESGVYYVHIGQLDAQGHAVVCTGEVFLSHRQLFNDPSWADDPPVCVQVGFDGQFFWCQAMDDRGVAPKAAIGIIRVPAAT